MDVVYEYLYEMNGDYKYLQQQQITAPTHRLRTIAAIDLAQIARDILDDLKIAQLGDPDLEDHIREELLEEYSEEEYDEWLIEMASWQEYDEQKRKYLEILRLTPSIFHAAVKEEIYV